MNLNLGIPAYHLFKKQTTFSDTCCRFYVDETGRILRKLFRVHDDTRFGFQVQVLRVIKECVNAEDALCLQATLPGTAVHEHHPPSVTEKIQRILALAALWLLHSAASAAACVWRDSKCWTFVTHACKLTSLVSSRWNHYVELAAVC